MRHFRYVVVSEALPGRDAEYNEWYDGQHIGDVLDVRDFVSAQRFRVVPDSADVEAVPRYFNVFEIETDDIAAVRTDMASRGRTPRMPVSDALNRATVQAFWVEAMGAPVNG